MLWKKIILQTIWFAVILSGGLYLSGIFKIESYIIGVGVFFLGMLGINFYEKDK